MIFPQPVEVMNPDGTATPKSVFAVDPQLFALARTVAKSVALKDCAGTNCLGQKPKIVVGGHGVTGPAFVDNKEFREYAHATFGAAVIDMETAAVAQVALINQVPFIAFRSLSDLAGGGPGENEMGTFFQLAADNSAAVVEAFVKALP
jgi:adenosylhomocysteine nucleosidase